MRAVAWLLTHDEVAGPGNLAAPTRSPTRTFMRTFRETRDELEHHATYFSQRGSVAKSNVILRSARWSELLFGLIALLLALGLPLTPSDGRAQFLLVHWYAMALAAFALVAALRQPSRLVWVLVVVLSVYFLTSVFFGFAGWHSRGNAGPLGVAPFMLSPLLVGMAALAQISVAIRCWQARGLWMRQVDGPSVTLVD